MAKCLQADGGFFKKKSGEGRLVVSVLKNKQENDIMSENYLNIRGTIK